MSWQRVSARKKIKPGNWGRERLGWEQSLRLVRESSLEQ